MKKVYVMIADGSEEVECLGVVDVLRRANIETKIVSVCGKTVETSHGVRIVADCTMEETDMSAADVIFLPGGMGGATAFAASKPLVSALKAQLDAGKRVAAVCASPALVLGKHGFLVGKKAVCYPGMEGDMTGAEYVRGARVVTDGNITTSCGPATTLELGIELVRILAGEQTAMRIKSGMLI